MPDGYPSARDLVGDRTTAVRSPGLRMGLSYASGTLSGADRAVPEERSHAYTASYAEVVRPQIVLLAAAGRRASARRAA